VSSDFVEYNVLDFPDIITAYIQLGELKQTGTNSMTEKQVSFVYLRFET
jgi:hypothetical protein